MRISTLLWPFWPLALLSGLAAQDLATGEAIFNSNCAFCHGTDGSGGRGPKLRGSLRNGESDGDITAVVRNGLPGTAMPKFTLEDDELQALVGYVQSLRKISPASAPPPGDKTAGKRIYESQGCSRCHQIGNTGSTLGPSLTRIGGSRSYEYLKASIVDPSADVPEENQAIRITTADGKRYQGIWANEDSFTIQIRLADESFASFDKQSLKALTHDKTSLMPAYHLSEADLSNLLAYLSSLTGEPVITETDEKRRSR